MARLKTSDARTAAHRAYFLLREVSLAGGGALEPLERVAFLTVVSGLRPFAFLTHVRQEDAEFVKAVVARLGLVSGVCKARFTYELDVEAPANVIDAFREYEARHPLWGLGVAKTRVEFGDSPLGLVLRYPSCCWQMDDATKSHDRSAALRLLIDTHGEDFAAVIRHLNGENTVETPHTTWKDAWEKRFDQTRCTFPFAIHTACDKCLSAGMNSPSGQISRTYERLIKKAAPDLHEAVLRQNEYFRQTSRFRDDTEAS